VILTTKIIIILLLPHNSLNIFHQNVPELKYKTNELLNSLYPDFHIMCNRISPKSSRVIQYQYIKLYLGSFFRRYFYTQKYKILYININNYCLDLDIEISGVKLEKSKSNIVIFFYL
jgi:hypothetical protein